jgi:hypothetical protein
VSATPEQENELTPAEQQGETADRTVYVLHNAVTGRIYIGQARRAEPEPEAGQ